MGYTGYAMPNCFTLTRKSDPDAGPVILAHVDDELRIAMGQPAAENYLCNWFNLVGSLLAAGWTWERIRLLYANGDTGLVAAIVNWLEANFVVDSWYDPKG